MAVLVLVVRRGALNLFGSEYTITELITWLAAISILGLAFWWFGIREFVARRLWKQLRSWYQFSFVVAAFLAVLGLIALISGDPCGACESFESVHRAVSAGSAFWLKRASVLAACGVLLLLIDRRKDLT